MITIRSWVTEEKNRGHLCLCISEAQDVNAFLKAYEGKHSIPHLEKTGPMGLAYNLSEILGQRGGCEWHYGAIWAVEDGTHGEVNAPEIVVWIQKDLLDFYRTGNILSSFKMEKRISDRRPESETLIGESLMIREEIEDGMRHRSGIWEDYHDYVEIQRLNQQR